MRVAGRSRSPPTIRHPHWGRIGAPSRLPQPGQLHPPGPARVREHPIGCLHPWISPGLLEVFRQLAPRASRPVDVESRCQVQHELSPVRISQTAAGTAAQGGHAAEDATVTEAQLRSHGPKEVSIRQLPPQERAPYRITRSGKRGRQRYKTKGPVYLPTTTVPPTVVAFRPRKGGSYFGGPIPLMGIGPRYRPMNITKYIMRQIPQRDKY